jgi:hypothetical protein
MYSVYDLNDVIYLRYANYSAEGNRFDRLMRYDFSTMIRDIWCSYHKEWRFDSKIHPADIEWCDKYYRPKAQQINSESEAFNDYIPAF